MEAGAVCWRSPDHRWLALRRRRTSRDNFKVPHARVVTAGLLAALVVGSLSAAIAQEPQAAGPQAPRSSGALSVAEALVDAFNRHDPEAMATLVHDDFELYYVDEAGVAALAVRGPEQLVAEMTPYFAARPDVRSTIAATIDGPVYVAFREQIVGGQSSLAVYEVRDGLIKRVWYYPAE